MIGEDFGKTSKLTQVQVDRKVRKNIRNNLDTLTGLDWFKNGICPECFTVGTLGRRKKTLVLYCTKRRCPYDASFNP